MTRDEFKQARLFAFSDIRREIALARASETANGAAALDSASISRGGGNFLAALGLLCYTEFGGKLKYNCMRNGREHASANFNSFFNDLGSEYQGLLKAGHKIYDIFRCGLAHEYYVKRSCTIVMVDTGASAGIVIEASGRYKLIVEKYCSDLAVQFEILEKHLFP
jgi:hypothetical protein